MARAEHDLDAVRQIKLMNFDEFPSAYGNGNGEMEITGEAYLLGPNQSKKRRASDSNKDKDGLQLGLSSPPTKKPSLNIGVDSPFSPEAIMTIRPITVVGTEAGTFSSVKPLDPRRKLIFDINSSPPTDEQLLQKYGIYPCTVKLVKIQEPYEQYNHNEVPDSPISGSSMLPDSATSSPEEQQHLPISNKKTKKSSSSPPPISVYDDFFDDELIIPTPSGPEVTDVMRAAVLEALTYPQSFVHLIKNGISMNTEFLSKFEPGEWLEDVNIDFYLDMIRERNNSTPGLPKIHNFHCYFYPMLNRNGYESMKSHTDGINIFEYQILFIPIALKDHWRLLVVDFRGKGLRAFDSLSRKNNTVLQKLKNFLRCEYNKLVARSGPDGISSSITRLLFPQPDSRLGDGGGGYSGDNSDSSDSGYTTPLEDENFMKDWTIEHAHIEDVPQQTNLHDCGVFLCQFAESLSRRISPPFDFTQLNMNYYRQLMAYETLTGELLPRTHVENDTPLL